MTLLSFFLFFSLIPGFISIPTVPPIADSGSN